MNIVDDIFECGLLIWYVYSIYDVSKDPTLDNNLKIIGYIINLLMIGLLLTTLLNQSHNLPPIGWMSLGILICWYGYYTPIDITNPGYTTWQKFGYGAIDISTILYLLSTVILSFMHSSNGISYLLRLSALFVNRTLKAVFA